jgi:hypothetical protein
MEYIVTSSKKVCGKVNGERLAESDIISAGGNVEHLLAAGHIAKAGQTPKVTQAPQVVKEEPQTPEEEPTVFVFKSDNNEGDK